MHLTVDMCLITMCAESTVLVFTDTKNACSRP